MQEQLTIDTLGDLDDGAAGVIINQEIKKAIADLDDRGQEDGKPRKVAIELELKHHEKMITATVRAQAKLPARQVAPTVAKRHFVEQEPVLLFNRDSPEDPDQQTMKFNEGEQNAQ